MLESIDNSILHPVMENLQCINNHSQVARSGLLQSDISKLLYTARVAGCIH